MLDMRSAEKAVRWWTTESEDFEACHAVWSADGKTIAMTIDYGVALYGTDGTKKRVVPGFSRDGWHSNDIASLSPDGSRIALLRNEARWGRRRRRSRSAGQRGAGHPYGQAVSLPLGGRTLHQVYFQSDGSMVVRVQAGSGYAVLLVDEDGRKISETAEPASLKDMQILAVVD